MAFEKGHKLSTGRPKGSVNRRTKTIEEIAQANGVDPLDILMKFAKGDWQGLGYTKGTKTVYTEAGAIEEDLIGPSERIQAAKEAAQYLYPKKKSIEHVTPNNFASLPKPEQIKILREALLTLEGDERDVSNTKQLP
jgi:hypothetical protein